MGLHVRRAWLDWRTGPEPVDEAPAGAMKPYPKGRCRDAKACGGGRRGEVLPGHEQHRLPIAWREARQRGLEIGVEIEPGHRQRFRGGDLDLIEVLEPPAVPTVVGEEQIPRGCDEPGTRVVFGNIS